MRKANNDFVAGFPAKRIIDQLQVIQVEIDDLVLIIFFVQRFHRLIQLSFESCTVHQSRHYIEGLFDYVLDLADDVRHETHVRPVKRFLVYAP